MTQRYPSSAPFRETFVQRLLKEGAIHSLSVRGAFLAIPRELFVPAYYTERNTLIQAEETPEQEYLEAMYANECLVTTVDERGWSVSSSSLPSIMAYMLEALDVHPGQTVLEVGTGTGYNAALLGQLTGTAQNVVSIEVDRQIANQACAALEMVSPGVTVIVGDGFLGSEKHAPYDRIIATASAPCIPQSWLQQLAMNGRLVMDLQGSLQESGFLVVEKTPQGIRGSILDQPLHFMPMRNASKKNAITAPLLQELHSDTTFLALLEERNFRWWLQWYMPGCSFTKQYQRQQDGSTAHFCILTLADGSGVRFRQQGNDWQVNVYGDAWEILQQAKEAFIADGKPAPQAYQFMVQDDRPCFVIGDYTFFFS